MSKCKVCGAIYRVNYPHGKMSKGVMTFEKNHKSDCPHSNNKKKLKKQVC